MSIYKIFLSSLLLMFPFQSLGETNEEIDKKLHNTNSITLSQYGIIDYASAVSWCRKKISENHYDYELQIERIFSHPADFCREHFIPSIQSKSRRICEECDLDPNLILANLVEAIKKPSNLFGSDIAISDKVYFQEDSTSFSDQSEKDSTSFSDQSEENSTSFSDKQEVKSTILSNEPEENTKSSFLAPSSIANESNGFYLSVGGGLAFPSDSEYDSALGGTSYDLKFEIDSTGLFFVGIGKESGDFRVEFNYSQATVESDSFLVISGGAEVTASITPALESDVKSYMIYGYKDFPNETKFTPYAGVGLGIASFSADNQTARVAGTSYQFKGGDESVFSFGLKGGASYEIANNTSLFSEVMYQNFASYEISKSEFETVNYDSTNFFAVTAGLKFIF